MRLFDPEKIDDMIINARKAYHHIDDAVYQLLDTQLFQMIGYLEITFVDFYRYVDVDLETVYDYLTNQTICSGRRYWPINQLPHQRCRYHIHQKERGYHNYALTAGT